MQVWKWVFHRWFVRFWLANCSKSREERGCKEICEPRHTPHPRHLLFMFVYHTLQLSRNASCSHPYKTSLFGIYSSVVILKTYWTNCTSQTKLGFIYPAILMWKTFAFGLREICTSTELIVAFAKDWCMVGCDPTSIYQTLNV